MSTMQSVVSTLSSARETSIVAQSNAHGLTPVVAPQLQASVAKTLGAKFSSLNGTAGLNAGVWRRSKSSDTAEHQRAATSTVKAVFKNILTGTKKNTVVFDGSLLVSKKSILDVINLGADLADSALDLLDLDITLQLVSVDLDPGTKGPKLSAKSTAKKVTLKDSGGSSASGDEQYTVKFEVPKDFGEVGAFKIWNPSPNKFYLHYMTLVLPDQTPVQFPCNSWVFNLTNYSTPRVFFNNKAYLPSATPGGLRALRQSELTILRGNGKGLRKDPDRIYDYDVYNDLGNPDLIPSSKRAPLGGNKDLPYPRRVRTGRPHSISDTQSELGLPAIGDLTYFVPPDEKFSREKGSGFLAVGLKSILHGIGPLLGAVSDGNNWQSFDEIKALFKEGLDLHKPAQDRPDLMQKTSPFVFLDSIFNAEGADTRVLNFPLPQLLAINAQAWMTDEEYGRQTLAGINPCVIALLKEFPPKSVLDSTLYGQGTALTEQHIQPYLEGKTIAEAIASKRLFTIDYHDIFLPYINRINALLSNKGYAPRSIFYYTDEGKMMPVAIELSLPPRSAGEEAVNTVFTPPLTPEADDHTWMLAKLHANTTDSNYHEIYSHFTRSHATMEPMIIASNRHLSRLHPIFSFLLPLFKNTMMINSVARQILINGGGVVETTSTPGKYTMEMSSKIYGSLWRFDQEALPEDLIARGMAERDGDGIKLVIEDYPFAADALEMWDAMRTYASKYVNIVYKDSSDGGVQSDTELQNWWNEIINVGHGDKKDESWWPKLDSISNLVDMLTTISWIAGPHHAATNFGQYAYSGFYPNKPSQTRKLIPEKGTKEYNDLQANPEKYWLSSISTQVNSTLLMVVFELLSTHSVDEEYVGQRLENNWTSDPQVQAAFAEFSANMKNIEQKQEARNKDPKLSNRTGPAKIPYTLLYPSSTSGLTGRGVPNSTSI